MKYGQGFWVVKDGEPVPSCRKFLDGYPALQPFEYNDGTGDTGWLLTKPFTFDYVKPGDKSGTAWRFTVSGDVNPVIHKNSFDFDGASVPQWKLLRMCVKDKMDLRFLVASLGHDLGHCIHEHVTGFTRADWNTFLYEVAECYGASAYDRAKYKLAVDAAGWAVYSKTDEELATYRSLVKIERVPL